MHFAPRSARHARWFALFALLAAAAPSGSAQVAKLLELDGDSAHDLFGRVAWLGDVDGDGFADFGVGSLRDDSTNGTDAGSVFLYSGRDGSLVRTWVGDGPNNTFGDNVANVGDTNADGYDDIAVTATSWNLGNLNQYVRVFSGRFLRDGTLPEVLFTHVPTKQGDVGVHLDGAGDVDGDGYADLIVGGAIGLRDAIVISGKTGASLIDLQFAGASDLGIAVAGLDDVDGDGFDDFLVGSYKETIAGLSNAGAVWLYSGGPAGTIGTVLDTLHGDSPLDFFGMEVVRLDDLDGDGIADFAVGATGQARSATSIPGYVRIFSGATRAKLGEFTGTNPGEFFGIEITAGDLDADGAVDFVISARYADDATRNNVGAVTAFSGADGSTLFSIHGHHAGDKIGRIDASADFDLDGAADLLLGTGHITVSGASDAGAVFLFDRPGRVATSSKYGTGLPGTLGIPKLEPDVEPALGSSFNLTVGNSAGAPSFGLLLLGTTSVTIPTSLGGDLLVDPTVVVAVTFGSSQDVTIPYAVPYLAGLAGAHFYLQSLELDAGALRGVSFSEGLDLLLGGAPW